MLGVSAVLTCFLQRLMLSNITFLRVIRVLFMLFGLPAARETEHIVLAAEVLESSLDRESDQFP